MSTILQYPHHPIDWAASPHDFTGDNRLGIYTRETTQRFVCGTRYLTWDGRVFKYAKASGTLQCDYWCKHCWGEFIEYETIGASQSVGDSQLTFTHTASSVGPDADGVIAEDEMAGGHVSVFMSGLGDSQNRGIIGNTALAADGTTSTIYVDFPFDRAITAGTDHAEALGNPYGKVADVQASADAYASAAGFPNVPATTGQYCFIQTWGIRWFSPTATATGGASQERSLYLDSNGGCSEMTYGTDLYNRQYAGYLVDKTTAGTDGAPFVMLKISFLGI
jgi:hypothetical protein